MSTSKVYQGLVRLMGENDQQLWNDQYAMLAPNDSTQHMVRKIKIKLFLNHLEFLVDFLCA